MAVFNIPNYNAKDGFGMSLNIRRGNPNPLDNSAVWSSLAAAQNYAKTDPIAYVGQILTVVEDLVIDDVTVKTATAYVIDNEAGDLKAVGSSPVGDEKTITVAEDGTVSLYGIEGLALTRTDDKGNTTKITYQPLLVDGKLTWVEPSATTVEGLAAEIEGLKTRISTAEDAIDAIESKLGDVPEGKTIIELCNENASSLQSEIQANTVAIEKLNGDSTVEGSVDKKVADAINDFATKVSNDETLNTFKELVDYVSEHGSEAGSMASAIEILETKVGEKSVEDQIADAITAENLDQYAKAETVEALDERVTNISDALSAQIATHSEDIVSINDEINGLSTDVIELQETTGAQASKINQIETDCKTFQETIDALIGDVTEGKTIVEMIADAEYDDSTLSSRVSSLENASSEQSTKLNSVEQKANSNESSISTLSSHVDSEITRIESLIDQKAYDDTDLSTRVDTVESAIETLQSTTTQQSTDITAINNKIGAVTEGKTVVQMINDVSSSIKSYDDTEVRTLISQNNTAIQEEIERALAAEKANADAIALLTNGAGTDTIDSVNELIEYVNTHGTTTAGIINILSGIGGEGQPATVLEAISAQELKVATSDTLGGVKASVEVTVSETGVMGIGQVSTDKLVQGEEILILNGGDAGAVVTE